MPRTTRNQRRRERQRRAKRRESEMTPETIATVRIWLDRMAVHARNAVDAARTVQKDELAEDNHLFWAIVKYAENVQESVVQLDKINESIFHALEEFPIESHVDELNWTDLKGMRIRLAHKFWDIDPDILWTTVTRDFPSLLLLLEKLYVSPERIDASGSATIDSNVFLDMSPVRKGDAPTLDNTIVCMYFDGSSKAQCIRIAKHSDTEMLIEVPQDTRVVRISEIPGPPGSAP